MAPGQLGEHNARGTPCPESAACPAPRHTAGPARSHHLRSKRNATREPGGLGRFGAARGRTRTVSAGTTRTTNPARSRQRALPPGAQQGHLDLTACDRYGARRVSRARRGRTVHVVQAHRVGGRPSAKGAHELHRLHMCHGLRRHPWHTTTSLLVPTNSRRDAPPSMEPVLHQNGAAGSPKAARTARRAPEPGAAARERVLLVCLRWGINRVLN